MWFFIICAAVVVIIFIAGIIVTVKPPPPPPPPDLIVRSSFTDTRDGRVYKTVEIGNQVWMAENLAYDIQAYDAHGSPGTKRYDNADDAKKYGILYKWELARDYQLWPEGWHLPTDDDWKELFRTVGGDISWDLIAGKQLKAQDGWQDGRNGESVNGTDAYCFSALPGGTYHTNFVRFEDDFSSVGDGGYWWSATGNRHGKVSYWKIISGCDSVIRLYEYGCENLYMSVRCVKNR
jgi:uncharacterized protein (TIGR02145 family)